MRSATRAWLGLGGNLGDVQAAMAAALQQVNDSADAKIVRVSSIYRTPPWGKTDQPWFLNCCAEVETSLSPEALLNLCQQVEHAGKRERVERWGPRTIDVDIIAIEGVEQLEQRLTLPHPRARERAFVLLPLAEIAPDVELNGDTVSNHLRSIDAGEIELQTPAGDWWKVEATRDS